MLNVHYFSVSVTLFINKHKIDIKIIRSLEWILIHNIFINIGFILVNENKLWTEILLSALLFLWYTVSTRF